MNEQRLLDTFLDLVRLPCPSGREARAAAYCKDALEDCGCTVTIDDAGDKIGSDTGNLYAELAGTVNGTIILTAHLDCVQPCEGVNPQIVDGVIYSDGTTVLGGDDKVGVAAIIEAVRTLVEEGGAYPTVKVIFSVQEETGCRGAANFSAAHFETGEPCFVFDDAGDVGGACLAAPYHYTFRAQFTGKASHAGVAPQEGISAIEAASLAVETMRRAGVLGAVGEYCASNIGTISGGSANNVVAPSCEVTGECRAVDAADVERVRAAMDDAMRGAAAQLGAQVDVEWELEYPGFKIAEDAPIVQMFCRAARAAGFKPRTFMSTGGTDANQYVKLGVDPLVVSTGMTKFHSVDECLKVADLENTARLACALVRERARCS